MPDPEDFYAPERPLARQDSRSLMDLRAGAAWLSGIGGA
jgi:hypothetical protein